MKIIFIGDIVGKQARETLIKKIPDIKSKYVSDVIIANAENSAAGYGLTKKIAVQLLEAGVDVITLGNHAWDQKEMLSYIEEKPNIIRAINFPNGVPGKGDFKLVLNDGRTIIVIGCADVLIQFLPAKIIACLTTKLDKINMPTTINLSTLNAINSE